jgi:hypothetical protein
MSSTQAAPIQAILPALEHTRELARRDFVLCRFCRAPITTRRDELVIGEAHQHRFINPAGSQFLIGCYRLAPGCDISGLAMEEYCWFEGYLWQYASCTDCGEHLGWFYQSGESNQFFGLIIDKLVRYQV